MRQFNLQLGLLHKALAHGRIFAELRREHFDGHQLLQFAMHSLVDNAHTTPTQQFQDLIGADLLANHSRPILSDT